VSQPQHPSNTRRNRKPQDLSVVVDQDENVTDQKHRQRCDTRKDKRRNGRHLLYVDIREQPRQVALLRPRQEQPGRSEEDTVDAAESGEGHENRNQPVERSEHFGPKRDGHRRRALDFHSGQNGEICDISKNVDSGYHGEGDPDRPREVLVRILEFFGDEVEEIPATESKQTRVEPEGQFRNVVVSLERVFEIFRVTCAIKTSKLIKRTMLCLFSCDVGTPPTFRSTARLVKNVLSVGLGSEVA
jgi:hypothetical protein